MTKQEITSLLRTRGIQPTQQRIAVLDYLMAHRTHPTADTLYRALVEEFPTFSRTTVYNTARTLAKAGLIRVITIDAEEQRFDAGMEQHGHFRCTDCGSIFDFPISQQAMQNLSPASYTPVTMEVYATGVCPHCQQQ